MAPIFTPIDSSVAESLDHELFVGFEYTNPNMTDWNHINSSFLFALVTLSPLSVSILFAIKEKINIWVGDENNEERKKLKHQITISVHGYSFSFSKQFNLTSNRMMISSFVVIYIGHLWYNLKWFES